MASEVPEGVAALRLYAKTAWSLPDAGGSGREAHAERDAKLAAMVQAGHEDAFGDGDGEAGARHRTNASTTAAATDGVDAAAGLVCMAYGTYDK